MTIFRTAAVAALIAAPLSFSPALAQDMMDDAMGDEMMAHDMNVTCNVVDMGEMGMTIEFHNMGAGEIPAGTMGHWLVPGVAQGDVNFMDAVAPGGMKSQNYAMMGDDGMMHMPSNAHCTVETK
jgi:hypothetical protein